MKGSEKCASLVLRARFSTVAVVIACCASAASCGGGAREVDRTTTPDVAGDPRTEAITTQPTASAGSSLDEDGDAAEVSELEVGESEVRADEPVGGPKASAPRPARFDTSTPRATISAYLLEPAKKALEERNFARAIALYRGLVTARGPGDPLALELAKAWTLASQYDEAIEVLTNFIEHTTDPKEMQRAREEVARLRRASNPFTGRFEISAASTEAKTAFQRGRAEFSKKRYADALVYFEMGAALDPDLPGFLRELGATYDKLGAADKKLEFYRAYLLQRPFGKNADEVRRQLAKVRNALGTLTIESALPCYEVWLNGQVVPGKLPKKELSMAPGAYKAMCYAPQYGLVYFETAAVEPGSSSKLAFRWAVLVNKLVAPYGRIAIEDPLNPGMMMDLGIDREEVGVIVPADGRSLRVVLKDDSGSRVEERYIKLQPGSRELIKW